MQQQTAKILTMCINGLLITGAIWIAGRFLLPWLAPFLIAMSLAALLEPAVRLLLRHGWRRNPAAGLLTLGLLSLLLWLLSWLTGRCASAVTLFARQVPALMDGLSAGVSRLERRILEIISAAPAGTSPWLRTALDGVGETLYRLPAELSQWALDSLGRAAQSSGDVLLFLVTAGIGTYFFSASFPRVTAFLSAQLPPTLRRRFAGLGRELKENAGAVLRAQVILMALCFCELLVAFLLLGIPGAPGIAALTALVDALPVFGVGTVLLPWALASLLLGNVERALGLAICWAAVNLLRSAVQARLLGSQIGLDPLASLLAIYVGWRVCGVWGMLGFPVLLVTLQQLNDQGVVHLWKSVE